MKKAYEEGDHPERELSAKAWLEYEFKTKKESVDFLLNEIPDFAFIDDPKETRRKIIRKNFEGQLNFLKELTGKDVSYKKVKSFYEWVYPSPENKALNRLLAKERGRSKKKVINSLRRRGKLSLKNNDANTELYLAIDAILLKLKSDRYFRDACKTITEVDSRALGDIISNGLKDIKEPRDKDSPSYRKRLLLEIVPIIRHLAGTKYLPKGFKSQPWVTLLRNLQDMGSIPSRIDKTSEKYWRKNLKTMYEREVQNIKNKKK